MPACSRCGTELPSLGAHCPRCGDGVVDAEPDDAPVGTWSSSVDSIFPEARPTTGEPSPAGAPRGEGASHLRVHRGGAPKAAAPPPLRAEAGPLPVGGRAVVPVAASLAADETAPRRRVFAGGRPAEVVRLHPAVSAPDAEAAPLPHDPTPEDGAGPQRPSVPPSGAGSDRPRSGEHPAVAPPPCSPRFLATALLREDLEPPQPARDTVRTLALGVGFAGGLVSALIGGFSPLTVLVVLVFAGMAVTAIAPIGFETRAGTLAGLSLLGIGIADWPRLEAGTGPDELLLSIGMLLLASFLLLRSFHRASRLARGGVAISLAAMVSWLVVTSSVTGPTLSLESWQAWADAAFRVALVLFLFLSLLAFIGPASRGACHLWAYGLVALYAAHALMHEVELLEAGGVDGWIPSPTAAALLLGVASLGVGALALAQLYAAARLRGLRGLGSVPPPPPAPRA